MPANYPASLPVKTAAGANLSTNPHSGLHNTMYDEIVALATELGTDVAGAHSTLKARLAAAYLRPSVFTRSATQSIPNTTFTAMSFTSEDSDDDGWGTVTTSTLTCPSNGYYLIVGYLNWENTATGTGVSRIYINGESVATLSIFDAVGLEASGSFAAYVTAGKTVQLMAHHDTGSAKNVDGARLLIKRLY